MSPMDSEHSCCAPEPPAAPVFDPAAAEAELAGLRAAIPAGAGADAHRVEQVEVPAGAYRMGDRHGDDNPADGELPAHRVELSAYRIDATSVTNDDFARFVEATGYPRASEVYGFSAVFELAVSAASASASIVMRMTGSPNTLPSRPPLTTPTMPLRPRRNEAARGSGPR